MRIMDMLYLYDQKIASYWTGKDLSRQTIDVELKERDLSALEEYDPTQRPRSGF